MHYWLLLLGLIPGFAHSSTFQKRGYLEQMRLTCPVETYPSGEISNALPLCVLDATDVRNNLALPSHLLSGDNLAWVYHWEIPVCKNVRMVYLQRGSGKIHTTSHILITLDSLYNILHVLQIGGSGTELKQYLREMSIDDTTIIYSNIRAMLPTATSIGTYSFDVTFEDPVESDPPHIMHDLSGHSQSLPVMHYSIERDGAIRKMD